MRSGFHCAAMVCASLSVMSTASTASTWVLEDVLTRQTDPDTDKLFGTSGHNQGKSVSLHGDLIAVGARAYSPNEAGSVYVFERTLPGGWQEVSYLEAGLDRPDYGASVAITGNHLAVGDPSRNGSQIGDIHIYHRKADGTYTESPFNTGGSGFSYEAGATIALDGSRWVAFMGGRHVLTYEQRVVSQDPYLEYWQGSAPGISGEWPNANGTSVAISGNTVAVGQDTWHYDHIGTVHIATIGQDGIPGEPVLLELPDPVDDDGFGVKVDLSGGRLIVSADYDTSEDTGVGAAYIFEQDILGEWVIAGRLVPTNPLIDRRFGLSVAISGDYAIVGSNADTAYIFQRDAAGIWNEIQVLTPSDPGFTGFGREVDIDGNTAIIAGGGVVHVYTIPEPTGLLTLAGLCALVMPRRPGHVWCSA